MMMTYSMIMMRNGLGDYENLDGFLKNEDVSRKSDWRIMVMLMGFTRMRMLPARLTRPTWMSWTISQVLVIFYPVSHGRGLESGPWRGL